MSTSEEEFGEVEDGVKIALFDVSDPENPKVLDSKTYKNYSSDVQYNHKALVVNSDEGWYAIPYSLWENETGGVLQFRVNGDKLEEISNYECEQEIDRCLFIDDYIYGLETFDDEIISWWKMRSLQDRNQVTEQIVFDDVSMDVEITILYVKNGVGKSDSKINLKS